VEQQQRRASPVGDRPHAQRGACEAQLARARREPVMGERRRLRVAGALAPHARSSGAAPVGEGAEVTKSRIAAANASGWSRMISV
jgi:hypothetical protein